MKTNGNSCIIQIFAVGAVFVSALSVINAQTLYLAPDNPAFIKYQQERAQKAVMPKTGSEYGRGLIPTPVDFSYLKGRTPVSLRTFKALSSTYDLRTLGKLTPIKNQNPYGTCWAFATYSSLESALLTGETNDFSENNLANNHGFDAAYTNGGDYLMSVAYLTRWSGPINEVDDPYTNGPGHGPTNLPPQKHVQEVLILAAKTNALDNTIIKQTVMDYGAIYVSMWSDFDTNRYFNSTNSAFYYNGISNCDHAVAIVGWDDDYAATNFLQAPASNGAFIVRNSWGTSFGDNGYFYCSYYDTRMCSEASAAFINGESVTNYSSVYQYDPLGWVGQVGYTSTTTAWGANIFTATNYASVRAVGFYAPDVNMNYTIYIYRNITAGSPRSGTLELTQTGSSSYAGYHTVLLNTPVSLSSGRLFSVVIKFINSSTNAPIAIEYAKSGYSSRATSSPGESYVSSDGTDWSDLTTDNPTANVCIKAFCGTGVSSVGRADPAMVVNGNWYLWLASMGYQINGPFNFGVSAFPVAADFDADGKADPTMVDGALWYIWFTGSGYQLSGGPWNFGVSGIPVAADFDADGKADPAMVVGPLWYIWFSGTGYQLSGGPWNFGVAGIPVAADFDADGKADPAMVVDSLWYIWFSGTGYQLSGGPWNFGVSGIPVAADFDADGKADPAMVIYNLWYIWFSGTGYQLSGGPWNFGVIGYPVAADFDGR